MTNLEPVSSRTANQHQYDDEIDLWELTMVLWRGKYPIIAIVLFFAFVGLTYSFTTEEKWNSSAKVIAPDYVNYQQVISFNQKLEPAFGSAFNARIKQLNFSNHVEIFNRFITLFNSNDNKQEFLRGHPTFKKYFGNQPIVSSSLNGWMEAISASTNKAKPEELELSFVGMTAKDSQMLLMDYIDFCNNKIAEELLANIQSLLTQREEELQQALTTLTQNTRNRIEREVARLTHSLAIANAANINAPIADPGAADEFTINLGTKAIEAKMKELKSLNNLAVLEPAILSTQNQLDAIKGIDLSTLPQFQSYKFVQAPTEPVSKTQPKTLLILLTCIMIGGIFGVIYVIAVNSIRKRIEQEK